MRTLPALRIPTTDRQVLQTWALGPDHRRSQRARIVFLAAKGYPNSRIADLVGLNANQVGLWRRRYEAWGIHGLADRARSGRPRRRDRVAS